MPTKTKDIEVAAPGTSNVPAVKEEMDYDMLQADGASTALQAGRQDLAIPFLRVLQSNSPQVNRDDPKYVPGAEAGMFINTVSNQLWEGREVGVMVAVVAYQRSYTEWKPRGQSGQSGGFVKDWGSDDTNYKRANPVPAKKNRMATPEGTEMVQSGNYFVFAVNPQTGAYSQMLLSLAGTQLKKSRRWNSLIKTEQMIHPNTQQPFTPPPFFRLYRLTTVHEQNDQGNWKGLKVEPGPTLFDVPNGGLIYKEALAFKKSIDQGEVKVQPLDAPEDPGSAGTHTGDVVDEDAPF